MKESIRQYYKTLRQGIPKKEVLEKSQAITKQLIASSLWQSHDTIMLYLSFGHEVDTEALFKRGWEEGKKLLIPICLADGHTIQASKIDHLDQLVLNQYKIRELPPDLIQPVAPEDIQLCVVPGIAFDKQGNRLGFGAGYYDRFLARLNPATPKVALAFTKQLSMEPLPTDPYDLPMDYICTDQALLTIRS